MSTNHVAVYGWYGYVNSIQNLKWDMYMYISPNRRVFVIFGIDITVTVVMVTMINFHNKF